MQELFVHIMHHMLRYSWSWCIHEAKMHNHFCSVNRAVNIFKCDGDFTVKAILIEFLSSLGIFFCPDYKFMDMPLNNNHPSLKTAEGEGVNECPKKSLRPDDMGPAPDTSRLLMYNPWHSDREVYIWKIPPYGLQNQ